jgi:hypothetical protein
MLFIIDQLWLLYFLAQLLQSSETVCLTKPKRSQKMKTAFVVFLLVSAFGNVLAAPPATSAEELLGQYYVIQKSLASDSIDGVAVASTQLAKISRRTAEAEPQARAQLLAIAEAATKLQAANLKSATSGFGELSDGMIEYLKTTGAKRNPPYQFFCSMVKKSWLQPDKETRNPYFGSSMLKCGELVQSGQSAEQPAEHQHH